MKLEIELKDEDVQLLKEIFHVSEPNIFIGTLLTKMIEVAKDAMMLFKTGAVTEEQLYSEMVQIGATMGKELARLENKSEQEEGGD